MKKRLLITGGSGFLGGHLVHLARKPYDVLATFFNNPVNLPDVTWRHLDLRDLRAVAALVEEARPEAIIHNAAMADIDLCEREPELARVVNYSSTLQLARKAEALGARFIYVSTDNVFDGDKGDYREQEEPRPVNYYGETKLLAERAVVHVCSSYVIARAALIYGPPILGGTSSSEWVLRKLQAGETVPAFVDQHRTPIYAPDLAAALLELVDSAWSGTVHLGGPERVSRYEFARQIGRAFGFSEALLRETRMKEVSGLARRPRDLSFRIECAQALLKTQFSTISEGARRMTGRNRSSRFAT